MKTSLLRVLFSLVIVWAFSAPAKACSPLMVPTLVSQAVVGTNLNLNWTGSTTYTCGYYVEVEFACNTSSFTGTGTPLFYTSATITPPGTIPYPYPLQSIDISTLCPGAIYKFRAREVYPPSTYSSWTSTFTFTTPGLPIVPTVSLTATPPVICPPATSQLNATVTAGCGASSTSATYSWSPTTGLSNPLIANPIASPITTTTYTCTVTGGGLGCWIATNTVTITTTTPPAPGTATVSPTTMCSGNPAILTLTGATGTIQWQSGPTSAGPWTNITGATTSPFTTGPIASNTCFHAVVTGCSSVNSNAVCITINPSPTVTVNSPTTCSGQTATLTGAGATSYLWSTGATTNSITVSPGTTTTYTVTGTTTGCTGSAVATVTANPYPVLSVSPAIICGGGSASIPVSGATTYLWSTGGTENPLVVNPTTATTYTVTGTSLGCSSTATVTVSVFPDAVAAFTVPLPISIFNPIATFYNNSSNAVTWNWDFGDPTSTTNTSTLQNPTHTYATSGTHCITLTVTSVDGCVNSAQQCIFIDPLFTFYIPNAFSPNGDYHNGEFYGKGDYIQDFDMKIYDRWGNLVFSADDINKHWDGKVQNKAAVSEEDVYVYIIHITDTIGEKHKYIGTVTIVK